MDHFGTYVRTYVQVIFEGSHPTLKLIKQKMYKIIHVNIPFFLFCQNPKNHQVRANNRFWDLKSILICPEFILHQIRSFWDTDLKLHMVIHCYILNTFWLNNVFTQSVPSGPIEPPKFNQGFASLNKDISRTVSRILKIRPHSRLQI